MNFTFIPWKPDADVCGEAAGMAFGDCVLDLVVTYGNGGRRFYWEVVDACDKIDGGEAETAAEAKGAAEIAGRRASIRAA